MSQQDDFFNQLDSLVLESAVESSLSTIAEVLAQIGACTTSIAISEKGRVTSRCYSTKNCNELTLFQACSISKPTTAMALMKMVEEGILSLSAKVTSVLPKTIVEHLTKDPRTAPLVETVTIRHLLSHRGGMSIGGFPGYADPGNVPTVENVVLGKGNTNAVQLITLPGLEVMYAGGGTELVQMIMENVLQKPFPEIMQKYIFEPLGMTRSCYKLPEGEKNVERCYWNGHWPTDAPYNILPEQAAGGLWTTPSDLLKLIQAMQASISGKDNRFMDPALAHEMVTALKDAAALGWFVNDAKFAHSGGNFPGWTCYAIGYADLPQNLSETEKRKELKRAIPSDCGIAIMTNTWASIAVVDKLADAIAYLKGWPSVHIPGANQTGSSTPFRAPKSVEIDRRWKEWLNKKWADEWELVENDQGLPAIKIPESSSLISLKPAATPATVSEGGRRSIDLIFDGFQLMLKLTWADDKHVIELWNGGTGTHKILKGLI